MTQGLVVLLAWIELAAFIAVLAYFTVRRRD